MAEQSGFLYKLTFPNGKEYIGITKRTVNRRFAAHVSSARCANTTCAVHSAIIKYGEKNVNVETLLIANYKSLKEIEQKAIAVFGTLVPNGYNITRGGDSVSDSARSEESRKKIGDASRGRTMSAEAREKIGAAQKGRRHTDQTKEKIRLARIGTKRSAETLLKMSASLKGKRLSEDQKERLRVFHTGRPKTKESIEKRKLTIATKKTALTE